MTTSRLEVPADQSAKLDRIGTIATSLPAALIHDDWTVAIAHAIDAYDSGARPFGPGSATEREKTVLALRLHNEALWAHIDNRDAACAAFERLVAGP